MVLFLVCPAPTLSGLVSGPLCMVGYFILQCSMDVFCVVHMVICAPLPTSLVPHLNNRLTCILTYGVLVDMKERHSGVNVVHRCFPGAKLQDYKCVCTAN